MSNRKSYVLYWMLMLPMTLDDSYPPCHPNFCILDENRDLRFVILVDCSNSQPSNDKSSLKWTILNLGAAYISQEWMKLEYVKFCTQVGIIRSYQIDNTSPPKVVWLWSRDSFKFLVPRVISSKQLKLGTTILYTGLTCDVLASGWLIVPQVG